MKKIESLNDYYNSLADTMTKEELFDIKYDSFLMQVSDFLYMYRIDNHLTQDDMAKKLNVSQPMINKYESGVYNFTLKSLLKLFYDLDAELNIEITTKEDKAVNNDPSFLNDRIHSYFQNSSNKIAREEDDQLHNFNTTLEKMVPDSKTIVHQDALQSSVGNSLFFDAA